MTRVAACLVVVLAACGGSSVSLETSRSRFSAGADLTLTLHNPTGVAAHDGLCQARIERSEPSNWVLAGSGTRGTCPAILKQVPPHSEASMLMHLDAALAPGVYRFVTDRDVLGTDVLESNIFEIAP